ncbi:MAG: FHA domain-containing protein [Elusimicrobia bacterium]|nr:FHA domain-containing protein [Elusimicrobiota bacterium]
MPKFLLKFNAAVIKEVPMAKESLTVGRKADNDVVIDNPAVSGHHCKISVQGGTCFVEDLDSTNGTYVNEKRIKKAGLHHNDVVGVARHALVFIEDTVPIDPAAAPAPKSADATVAIPPEKQAEIAAAQAATQEASQKLGVLKVLKGEVGAKEYELKGMSTYLGKSDRVQVPIKGSGLFGSAPEVAASIHRKPDGYYLLAIEEGYPAVNGVKVSGSMLLKDGDLIECGGTTIQFNLKDIRPDATKAP